MSPFFYSPPDNITKKEYYEQNKKSLGQSETVGFFFCPVVGRVIWACNARFFYFMNFTNRLLIQSKSKRITHRPIDFRIFETFHPPTHNQSVESHFGGASLIFDRPGKETDRSLFFSRYEYNPSIDFLLCGTKRLRLLQSRLEGFFRRLLERHSGSGLPEPVTSSRSSYDHDCGYLSSSFSAMARKATASRLATVEITALSLAVKKWGNSTCFAMISFIIL